MDFDEFAGRVSRTKGREATQGVIPGRFALSVGSPALPAPAGWKWTSLSDVAELESGHTPSRKHPEYWNDGIPWIGIKDAVDHHGRVITDTHQHVSQLGLENSSARLLPSRTVCLSRTASVGYVVVMGRPMATSQDFVNWVCGPGLEPDYLKYVFLVERESLLRFASGTTHQTIYYPEAKAFHALLPSVENQRRILAVLAALDDKIELNRRMNETLEAMARALFKSWFVDFDPVRAKAAGRTPVGMDADTANLFPSDLVDSGAGEIPKGWRSVALAEAAELNPPRRIERGVPAPYVEMSSLPTTGHRPSAWPSRRTGSGARFQNGDTLLARITPCLENGKTGYVDFLDDGAVGWGSTEYIVVRPRSPLPPEWGYLLARDNVFREFAARKMEGTTGRQRVSADALGRYVVTLPSSAVGERFGEFVGVVLGQAGANHHENATLVELRDALLPRLLSGELSVETAGAVVEATG